MAHTLTEDKCLKLLTSITESALELAREVPGDYEAMFKEPMHLQVEKPEYRYLVVLLFLSLRVISIKHRDHPEYIRQWSHSFEALGHEFAKVARSDIKDYQRLFEASTKPPLNPIFAFTPIAQHVFGQLTGNYEIDEIHAMWFFERVFQSYEFVDLWDRVLSIQGGA